MRRVLITVNILIAIVLVAAVAGYYWIFRRALPRTSGTIETFVSQPVEVNRDRLGVPHIKARTFDDAWFTQGYTTAEDRMFQMDALRRLASGELAEVVGRPRWNPTSTRADCGCAEWPSRFMQRCRRRTRR